MKDTKVKDALKEVVSLLENVALTLSSLETCLVERNILQDAEIDKYRPDVLPEVQSTLSKLRSLVHGLPDV